MRVNIDDSPFSVEGLDIFTEFCAVTADEQWPSRTGPGVRVDAGGEHVWIDPDLIAAAADRAGSAPSWREGFERMRSFAGTKGWLDDRGWIRAHVVTGG
ncbi:hypothetical protein ACWDUN_20460 [Mycobacterium sp. NPDC003323]|uniref:hypothetical protein n=1 Tax=Mycolicibacterium neoaurum TaxID=1795 RepID=UPI001BCE6981|nr:hypothetical protein [Mycolicibacterium neoaurum]QVI27318.1 hypothetical protein MN2019_24465 [Mycolicibacterium neoaurum]